MVTRTVLRGQRTASRVIKRYSNRKLYDTQGSRYVTLLQIADMVRAGEEVQIIDNRTQEDKTEITMAMIISEELRERPSTIDAAKLKALIQDRGERLLASMRVREVGTPGAFSSRRRVGKEVAKGDHHKDGASKPNPVETLQAEIKSLTERLNKLERRLAKRGSRTQNPE